MIGTRLTELLLQKGYAVRHLERTKRESSIQSFIWNIAENYIEPGAFTGVDAIVHLAGAGIADKRWTKQRKKEILESRTQSTELLFKKLKEGSHQVKSFVCASAIGYYGYECQGSPFREDSAPGTDFLAHVTQRWENEAMNIESLSIRVVTIRTGIVLSKTGGALEKIALPIRYFVGAPLGTGTQRMSWIHMDDHCEIIVKAIVDEGWSGAYNSVAPGPVSNAVFTRSVAAVLKRPVFLPRVPEFALNLLLGQMATAVTTGCDVSADKVQKDGYLFRFPRLEDALKDLLN